MSTHGQRLFELLPAFFRLKDAAIAKTSLSPADQSTLETLKGKQAAGVVPLTPAEQLQLAQLTRGPLQSLLMLIGEQLAIVSNDLDQLYDDLFIETCAPWVIPYIGDLIGYQTVQGSAPSAASPRAEVAHTISLRRRKGTILLLEELARDVTSWGAHAVEMFDLLGDTQYMNHVRKSNHYSPDLRSWQTGAYMNSGFDCTAHKVDVRRITVERGRYNIQNIAVFLWSQNAYSMTDAPLTPVPGDPHCFRFSSLGCDMPLFHHLVPLQHPLPKSPDITGPAEAANVADRLSRNVLCDDIQNARGIYYGLGQSLALTIDGVFQSSIRVCDLAGQDGNWTNMPSAGDPLSIDPEMGRVALPNPPTKSVTASFYYGFNADIGGGEYPRVSSFPSPAQQPVVRITGTSSPTAIQDALDSLNGEGVVEITDSGTYDIPDGLNIQVAEDARIQLRAADGCRPTLNLCNAIVVTGGKDSVAYLNGLLIAYTGGAKIPLPSLIRVPKERNNLSKLELVHCTLIPGLGLQPPKDSEFPGSPIPAFPGAPVLVVEASGVQVVIGQSIIGAMWMSLESTVDLTDSIVDSAGRDTNKTGVSGAAYVASVDARGKPSPGGALTMNGCTVIGKVYASMFNLVSDCIIWAELSENDLMQQPSPWQAALWSTRKQQGCIRFSYIPAGSAVPRHFQCIERGDGAPQPLFYSLRYGDPDYAKLWPGTDDTIRRGAEDGGEMGAFHFAQAPSRENDLRVRIREYLPAGLEFGLFYEN